MGLIKLTWTHLRKVAIAIPMIKIHNSKNEEDPNFVNPFEDDEEGMTPISMDDPLSHDLPTDIPQDIVAEIDALAEDLPGLTRLNRFTAGLGSVPWFAKGGDEFSPKVRAMAESYLQALGFPDCYVAQLETWGEAAEAAEALDMNPEGWEAEEQLRAGLISAALTVMSEDCLTALLSHVSARAGESIIECVQEMGALLDIEDEGVMNAAAGSAVLACHQAALLLLAGDTHGDIDDPQQHAFAFKFGLLDLGHWPVGLHGQSYNIF
jgi:hypothetical protein